MGTHFEKRLLLKSFCRIMITFGNSLWVLSFNSLFLLLDFISNLILRFSSFRKFNNKDDKIDLVDSPDLEPFGFFQSESFQDYLFGFQFQTIEESESQREEEEEEEVHDGRNPESDYSADITETPLIHSAIKFQTLPVKAARGFLETPEDASFNVKEVFVNPDYDSQMISTMDVSDHGLESKQEQGVPGEEDVSSENREVVDKELGVVSEGDKSNESLSPSKEPKRRLLFHFDQERDFSAFSVRTPFPVLDHEDEENDLDFLEKISDLVRNFEDDSKRNVASKDKAAIFNGENQEFLEDINREIPFTICNNYSTEEDDDDDDEEGYIIDLEPHRELGFISERKSTGDVEESLSKEENTIRRWDLDLNLEEEEQEDEDGFNDILLQHRVMVEQLKMDAKSSRSGGRLATIMEECETMKMTSKDLKPLRLEERLDHKDHMNEIQKVYRSYTEKMKKLDILNYQTLHAISFLHMKDPSSSSSSPSSSSQRDPILKSPVSAIKTLLLSTMWPCKLRRIYSADPTVKSMAELHRDLETVYLGQACLSWEILQWQYDKSKELLLNDTDSQRSYGQAACEFQQFQVLVQRFVENEAFQGSRVENYARNRCLLRTILQVPDIKDDCLKNRTTWGEMKRGAGSEEEKKISIAALMDVIEESMRSFWEFIRADKEDGGMTSVSKSLLYGRGGAEQQKKDEMELLNQLRTTLQKKEKRVKGIVKSGNCLVRKFQKKQKEGTTTEKKVEWTEAQLIAQVELKLVGRVMKKTRITQDQLIWCQKKLNDLTIIKGNIHIEPSFMLFPF